MITARTVTGRKGAALFDQAARNARLGDPRWVPPFLTETRKIFHPSGTPFNRRNHHAFVVAFQGDNPVGRIMLIEDRDHLALHKDGAAHFGYLEAIDDPKVFDVLLAAAEAFARSRGLTRLEGPYSGSINHELGLLVRDDGRPATYRTNDAPLRYAENLVRLGFDGIKDLVAVETQVAESRYPEEARAALAAWGGADRIRTRGFNLLRFGQSVRETDEIYNDAWAGNWHHVPPDPEEARFIAAMMLPAVFPGWLRTADLDGKPVAILSMIPDLNEAARGLDGRLLPFGWLKFRLALGRVKRARIALIGLRRALHGTQEGQMVMRTLLAEAVERARRARIAQIETSWILADNAPALKTMARLPARETKRWRVFAKDLA